MTDPLKALLVFLQSDTIVRGLVDDRVYGEELPRPETNFMPRKVLIVKPAGIGISVEAGSYSQLTSGRYDVWSYGETPYEARQLQLASYSRLKGLQRQVVAGVLLHGAERVGGPLPIRDPITFWPIHVESFQVLASDIVVT